MTRLLEIRQRLRSFYGRYEVYVAAAVRFVLALAAFLMINNSLGYMKRLDSPLVAVLLALVCTFLPMGVTVLAGAILILAHLYSLSVEVALVGAMLFLVMFFLYFWLARGGGCGVLLTTMLCYLKIPQVMPTALGLGARIHSAVAMVCGLVSYYFLKVVKANEGMLGSASEEVTGSTSKMTALLQDFLGNKEMLLTILAFLLTIFVVSTIRRQSMNYAWYVAIAVGNILGLIVQLAGNFVLGIKGNILWVVLGTVAAVVVGLVMQFFLFHLDYPRTERVQFEDDEYYYYVKAVPKIYVHSREKRVKQINRRSISKKELAEEFDISQDLLDD